MASSFVLKMAIAVCVAMLLVQSSVAARYEPRVTETAGGGLACPSAETPCRARCRIGCDKLSRAMCQIVCGLSPSPTVSGACVNNFLIACTAGCKTACHTLAG